MKLNYSFYKKTLFIVFLFISLSCKEKTQNSSNISGIVKDIPWQGNPESIPPKMRETNPLANTSAKKGGSFRIYAHQFPKSLNYYLEQFATTAQIFTMMYETLTAYHPETLETIPHIAREWKISEDKKTFTFLLDKNAMWSDGKPITTKDILFTYDTIMNPKHDTAVFRIGLSRFEKPKAIDEYTVEFKAKEIHWNNFNEIATGFLVLPEHVYKGMDFNRVNIEFPVVSGPYKIVEVKKGRYIKMQRRGDYWQRAYPFVKGRYNFDELVFKVYNQENIALQALKKGDLDIFPVYTASVWATETKGDKFQNSWIIKQRVFNQKPIGFQGWAMNMRRDVFKDKRVRKAMAHLVPRKMFVEKLMFNEYELTDSYFPDFYLLGEKNPNEPIDYNPEKARALLKEAGWKANQEGYLEKDGKKLEFSVLERDQRTSKYITPFIERAKQVGVRVNIETTDLAAWSQRIDSFDFDMTWTAWGGGIFKDPEPLWFSKYADEKGQHNLPGLKLPEIDKIIEEQKTIFDVNKRNALLKKLDTIIYKEYPYVLLWHLNNTRLLYWNKFGMPKNPLGKYGGEGFSIDYWWYDEGKADALNKAMKDNKALEKIPENIKWME